MQENSSDGKMEDKKTYYKRFDDEYQPYVYDVKQNDFDIN